MTKQLSVYVCGFKIKPGSNEDTVHQETHSDYHVHLTTQDSQNSFSHKLQAALKKFKGSCIKSELEIIKTRNRLS